MDMWMKIERISESTLLDEWPMQFIPIGRGGGVIISRRKYLWSHRGRKSLV